MNYTEFSGEIKNIFNELELINVMYDYYRSKIIILQCMNQFHNKQNNMYIVDSNQFKKYTNKFHKDIQNNILYSYNSNQIDDMSEIEMLNLRTDQVVNKTTYSIVHIENSYIGICRDHDYVVCDINFNELYHISLVTESYNDAIKYHHNLGLISGIDDEDECAYIYDMKTGKQIDKYDDCHGINSTLNCIITRTNDYENGNDTYCIYKNHKLLYTCNNEIYTLSDELYIIDGDHVKQIDNLGNVLKIIGLCDSICNLYKIKSDIILCKRRSLHDIAFINSKIHSFKGDIISICNDNVWIQEKTKLVCYYFDGAQFAIKYTLDVTNVTKVIEY